MSNDYNDDKFHGYRYLLDTKNNREYAVRFDGGKMKPPQVFADDAREAAYGRNETLFALDDDIESVNVNGNARVRTLMWQIQTGPAAVPTSAHYTPVEFSISLRAPQTPDGDIGIIYTLTPESIRELKEETDFVEGFPTRFEQSVPQDNPVFGRAPSGNVLINLPELKEISILPQHAPRAYHARYAIESESAAIDQTQTAPQETQQPQRPPVANNDNGNSSSKPAPKRPADTFRNATQAPPRKMQVPDAALEGLLNKYCTDLTDHAARNLLDPVKGREEDTRNAVKILSRRKQGNVCFTGDAGVGKTAMFRALAQYINKDEDVPESLQGARILELDLTKMNAGAKFRGQFEEKLKPLIDGLIEREGVLKGRKIILAIDEIHSQLTAGKAEGGTDAANIMKPFFTGRGISVIGATTSDEYKKHIEKDPALQRRFKEYYLEQSDVETTISILETLWPNYKEHHGITQDVTAADLEYIVRMTNRYAPEGSQPDKAETALDTAAAAAKFRGSDVIEKRDLIDAVAQIAKLSPKFLDQSDHERFLNLENALPKEVLGQDQALRKITDGLIGARSGLNDPKQPWGCFVLQGPTGTGKTETCKALAKYLFGDESALIQINMAEYSEKHSVSRLIGAPPGYVGFDSAEPALTEQIRKRPYSILLLDEIEKAHPDVFNVLLPVLNDGEMKDNQGKVTRFNNVIIVMTTNLGASEAMAALKGGNTSMALGGSLVEKTPEEQSEQLSGIYAKARTKFFSRPEMINRIEELGGFVTYIPLAPEVVGKLVDREIGKVNDRLSSSTGAGVDGAAVSVSADVKAQLAKEGYIPSMGARPLRKVVREKIANPLGRWIMSHKADLAAFAAENGGVKLVIDSLTDFSPKMVAPTAATDIANDDAAKPKAKKTAAKQPKP